MIVSASSLMSSTCVLKSTTAPAAIAAGNVTAPRSLGVSTCRHAWPQTTSSARRLPSSWPCVAALPERGGVIGEPLAQLGVGTAVAGQRGDAREPRALRRPQQRRRAPPANSRRRAAPRRRGRGARAARGCSGWRRSPGWPPRAKRGARRPRRGPTAQIGFQRSLASSNGSNSTNGRPVCAAIARRSRSNPGSPFGSSAISAVPGSPRPLASSQRRALVVFPDPVAPTKYRCRPSPSGTSPRPSALIGNPRTPSGQPRSRTNCPCEAM